ncbi:hypothetical protein VINI7043_09467 [Vibrio nigripulchritudo ATCC 27043]|uniref:Uncharacterized protein n=1 Tax=Vibrio nigripulchritudo SOn1 TaxID=1238450 RepID=A0AAV2VVB9_9VIBR|nr:MULTISPECIES: hypothetical protein [Vibrio]EGU58697.1 hypothetical protein VINI7043_09467 [Vibrio nigripulchritudo ATCC 27043]KJY80844.1 hypothetical protein TW74_00670 [Vibrio nigripulchritudo]UAB69008.1 hypothetical protein INR79_10715 [Vibrio sp. SCSIO 43132]CCN37281.1 conserved hypothetical protein [Vibrio nigripulchritudo AM115]CCN41395.1 conserved hypothetical protein [Vibrio nigripulchritudo FTn2]
MLWETMERVNKLRQQALADPEFIKAAKEHEKALRSMEKEELEIRRRRYKAENQNKGPKLLSDIYRQSEFGSNPTGEQH